MIQKIAEAAQFLRDKGFDGVSTAIVLGTGLGELVNKLTILNEVSYHEIPHFVHATVGFHKGKMILAGYGDIKLILMLGRFHYYEGYSMQEVTFPVRVLPLLGVEQLILTNAAGGINRSFKKGELILLNDHINMQPDNPLRGLNDPAFGNRFVDMSCPYDKKLSRLLKAAAGKRGLKKGVYVAVTGPNLETRAEYRYLRAAGADMVGMSTVPEVIVANHIGLPCAAISIITDECDPDHLEAVSIEEIISVASKADKKLTRLLLAFLALK